MKEFTENDINDIRQEMDMFPQYDSVTVSKSMILFCLDEIERLQECIQELKAERFNKCSDCCYVTPSLDLCKNKNEVTA